MLCSVIITAITDIVPGVCVSRGRALLDCCRIAWCGVHCVGVAEGVLSLAEVVSYISQSLIGDV